jgi:Zn-finger domain-containing protein
MSDNILNGTDNGFAINDINDISNHSESSVDKLKDIDELNNMIATKRQEIEELQILKEHKLMNASQTSSQINGHNSL